jgi:hypothetical protein
MIDELPQPSTAPSVRTLFCAGTDVVLISHLHSKRLDLPSVRRVGGDVKLITSHGADANLRSRHFRVINEIEPGGSIRLAVSGLRQAPIILGALYLCFHGLDRLDC